jgi:cell division protein FtsB
MKVIDSLNIQLFVSQKTQLSDSLNYAATVTDLQKTLKAIATKNKQLSTENAELKAGLYRYKINIFGKEKLIKQ